MISSDIKPIKPFVLPSNSAGKRGSPLVHIVIALMTIGMTGAIIMAALLGGEDTNLAQILFGVFTLLALIVGLIIAAQGTYRCGHSFAEMLLIVIVALGVVGIITGDFKHAANGFMFAAILLVRNFLLFVILPRTVLFQRGRVENVILGWWLAATSLVTLGSLQFAISQGHLLLGNVRLGLTFERDHWIHPNHMANYAACSVLICIFAKFIPQGLRWVIAFLGCYILLLTQGRTSIIALPIAICAYALIGGFKWKPQFVFLSVFLLIMSVVIASNSTMLNSGPSISENPLTNKIVRGVSDPTHDVAEMKRFDVYNKAIEELELNPLAGYGFRAELSELENGFLSLAVEVGYLGLGFYIIFVLLMILKAYQLIRYRHNERANELGRIVVTITVFVFTRAISERSNMMMISDPITNVWMLFCGLITVFRFSGQKEREARNLRPMEEIERSRPVERIGRLSPH